MTRLVDWISSHAAVLSIVGVAVTWMVSTVLQIAQRRAEAAERQFQAFHKIVEQVVSPEPKDGLYYFDRQAAVIFELRHFPRYYDFAQRLLTRLRKKWVAEATPSTAMLVEEIDLTLQHIRTHR
jgi:hypothetical protein